MGSHTYVKVYHHLVWSAKDREPLMDHRFRENLYKFIGSVMVKHGWHLLAIGGTADHIHIFFCVQKMHEISDIVRCLKANSSQFVRCNFTKNFGWQEGYGWFSCTNITIDDLKRYIMNQENHHDKESYDDEMAYLSDN